MQTLIHADIFFFVTTIVEVLVAAALIVVLVYIAVILSDIRELSRTIKNEGAEIAEDVDILRQEFRHEVHQGASAAGSFFQFIQKLFKQKKARHHKSKSE